MVFGKLEGLSGIADDTLVYGMGEAQHDGHIPNVLNTARENSVKLKHYVFGKKVIIETDHKPLESIWKTITIASTWLQRVLLKMAKYDIEIRYIQGKTTVIAETLSRVSYMEPPLKEDKVQLQALYQ